MEEKLSFLFVTWNGGGNVPPVLGLAANLVARGHYVRVLTEPCLKEAVAATGADFKAFKKYFDRIDGTVDIIQDWDAKLFTIPSVENVLIRPASYVATETLALLRDGTVDVVVADFMMIGSLIAAEAEGIKRVALFHMPEYLPGPGRPPGGMGLLPSNSLIGRIRDKVLSKVFNRVINQYLSPINSLRKTLNLPTYRSLLEVFHQADLRLIQTSKVFDAPITPAPSNVRYVGPVLDDPSWADSKGTLWPESDTRPLVVVSLSSTFQNQYSVLQRIIKAVTEMDIRCLITLGPAMSKESFQLPDNVIALASIPHSQIFPLADAVITHAGHGTVMRALAYGLPLVCMPMGRDQLDNATLTEHHGAGLKLSSNARSNQITKAVHRVLEEKVFAKNAQLLQKCILADAKAGLAVSELEYLAAK
mgnify:CR=1 FL=1